MNNAEGEGRSRLRALEQVMARRYLAPEERLIGVGHNLPGAKFLWGVLGWYTAGYLLIALAAFLSGELPSFSQDYLTPSLGLLLALALYIDHVIGDHIRTGVLKVARQHHWLNVRGRLEWLEEAVLKTVFDQRTRMASGLALGALASAALLLWFQPPYREPVMTALYSMLAFGGGFVAGSALSGSILVSVAIRKLSSGKELNLNIHYPVEAKICIDWSIQISLGLSLLAGTAYLLLTWVPWSPPLANQQMLAYLVLGLGFWFALIAFLVPVLSFHRVMAQEKERLLSAIADEEKEAYGMVAALLRSEQASQDKLTSLGIWATHINLVKGLRESAGKISAWPLNIDSIGSFMLSSAVSPAFAILLAELIKRLVGQV